MNKIRQKSLNKFHPTFELWLRYGAPDRNLTNPRDAHISFMPDEAGFTAIECLFANESYGETRPCREPELAAQAIAGRASLKINMENWRAGRSDGTLPLVDWMTLCEEENLPDWVFREVNRGCVKNMPAWAVPYANRKGAEWDWIAAAKAYINKPAA